MQTYGRLPRKPDPKGRTLRAEQYLAPVAVPSVYNFDKGRSAFPILNQGQHGDCTVVSAATVQMRMERAERKATLKPIGPDGEYPELLTEYNKIAQPNDGGAYMLDELNQHRQDGIPLCAGKKHGFYKIAGYAEVIDRAWGNICAALFQYKLLQIGLMVTDRMEQLPIGVVEPQPHDQILGGHALCVRGYFRDPTPMKLYGQSFLAHGLLVAATWGGFLYQILSPTYIATYCDEIYGLVDASDALGASIKRADLLADVRAVTAA